MILYTDLPLVAAETYLNRYKNGWIAHALADKQFYDNHPKQRGRKSEGAGLRQEELPFPISVSRFPWPQVPFVTPSSCHVNRYNLELTLCGHMLQLLPEYDQRLVGHTEDLGSKRPVLQSQGKGNSRGIEKCGVCRHCLKPNLRKACLNPIPRVTDEAEGTFGAK